jgi:riboflavin kinase/FMN adenylyltransferase
VNVIGVFWGKVRKGKSRGKGLGFPTANISLHKKIEEGIYASTVKIQGKTYNGATFIGSAKTFEEKDYKAEVYILDFNQNIYDQFISVRLLKKIRDNKKFNSEKELKDQIYKDVKMVKKLLLQ